MTALSARCIKKYTRGSASNRAYWGD